MITRTSVFVKPDFTVRVVDKLEYFNLKFEEPLTYAGIDMFLPNKSAEEKVAALQKIIDACSVAIKSLTARLAWEQADAMLETEGE